MDKLKLKRRNRPLRAFTPVDMLDMDNFFEKRFWNRQFRNDDFWNDKSYAPALNVKELDDHFEIELAAPGFNKKDFEITLENGYLNIAAEKSKTEEINENDFTRREFNYNSFERSILLPEEIENEAIKAKYQNGILQFDLAKREIPKREKAKKVEIS